MTPLTRRVVRESAAMIHEAARNRPIVVTLEPPGRMIGFRPKGTRKTYYLPIDWCYARAVQAQVDATRRVRGKRR
jgi:hypothetical protein